MKPRSIVIVLVILIVMTLAVLAFVYPAITKRDAHINADKLFVEGIACDYKEDYACAADRYRQAIATYGQDSRYYTYLAQLQIKQGSYADAIESYQQAKAIDPSDAAILPALNEVIGLQATRTAAYLLGVAKPTMHVAIEAATAAPPASQPTPRPTSPPAAVYQIFDEDFVDIKSVIPVSQSADDQIKFEIVDDEAYSGKKSLQITWQKLNQHWASLILGFDSDFSNSKRAAAGQLASINLSPPSDYAIQLFAKRARPYPNGMGVNEMTGAISLKFQDQNLLIKESLGNQAVYVYRYEKNAPTPIPDGRLRLQPTGWQEFCLPLIKFDTDYWVKEEYKDFPEKDRQFDWSNVKQINIDVDYFATDGSVYIDAMRIVRSSDCIPYTPVD